VRLRPINATDYTRYWRRWNVFTKPRLFLALSAGFSFRNAGVKDEELVNSFDGKQDCSSPHDCKQANVWEKVAEEYDYIVFRRKLEGHPGIYQWYCAGTYKDITPKNFVNAQNDVTFRRQWDANVMELEIVESDDATDSQVVRWVSKFPYPMKPRIYVFVRRQHVDEESKRIVVLSQALSAKEYPEASDHVRVTTYRSRLMVQAHTNFEEDGFDYILEYYDDPQSSIPTPAYNWIIQYGGPHYLKRVHEAAKKLEAMTAKE
ncbi:START domain containing protein, partial [Aphelenchoides avenae]